jgi:hypothetical protein
MCAALQRADLADASRLFVDKIYATLVLTVMKRPLTGEETEILIEAADLSSHTGGACRSVKKETRLGG